MQVSTPAAPARGRARNNTRLRAFAESCTRRLSRAKRPSAQWCVSPGCKFGPDRNRRLDTGGAAQSATPYGRLKFSPRSRPSFLRKVTSGVVVPWERAPQKDMRGETDIGWVVGGMAAAGSMIRYRSQRLPHRAVAGSAEHPYRWRWSRRRQRFGLHTNGGTHHAQQLSRVVLPPGHQEAIRVLPFGERRRDKAYGRRQLSRTWPST